MRKVVVTGLGIVSPLGNNKAETLISLRQEKSGITFNELYVEMGLRSHLAGRIDPAIKNLIDPSIGKKMSDAAIYAYVALSEAIEDAGLERSDISHDRTGLIAGSAGISASTVVKASDILRNRGIDTLDGSCFSATLGSNLSANLGTLFEVRGVSYSLSSACATSAHSIGHALELIQLGKQDLIFAGGGDEEHWAMTVLFDAIGALSTANYRLETASRPYDIARDGFVVGSGAGFLVVEEYEHAIARGAKIYAEISGYGASSDGYDMVAPSGEGAERAMRIAVSTLHEPVDYLNTHGTSTPRGDPSETQAIKRCFKKRIPRISSTKALSGHALGAAGVHEAIYSLLMLENDFICASANIEMLDPVFENIPIVRTRQDDAGLDTILTNSFGFGGTNASLAFSRI
ncbi:MAG: beta-ketoacyl-ACP synthase I [Pseudomonadales bacterium]|nr:beta-ketoacyl-ACP synthase I [Pseudomonadales bacterium]MBO6596612.1 beta-ketoacyl-ACP synthase I [Pseudomonadales bacterium]MBO6823399.1 beta-ketoacyl-ACP synthase I [Pseudomonadales bacterium]